MTPERERRRAARSLQSIPDDELLHRLAALMGQSRSCEADIVAHIGEVDERRLYAREAFPSMFAYCIDVLHLSEAEAYLCISAARASREHPVLLTMLADGRLHLTAIDKLAPHLTGENRDRLLERATHKSKRQILEMIAEIAPRPDVPVMVRKLPERRALPAAGLSAVPNPGERPMLELRPDPMLALRPDGVAAPVAGAPRPVSLPVVQPLSPGRYKVQFTASAEFHHKLERLRALMSSVPDVDLALAGVPCRADAATCASRLAPAANATLGANPKESAEHSWPERSRPAETPALNRHCPVACPLE